MSFATKFQPVRFKISSLLSFLHGCVSVCAQPVLQLSVLGLCLSWPVMPDYVLMMALPLCPPPPHGPSSTDVTFPLAPPPQPPLWPPLGLIVHLFNPFLLCLSLISQDMTDCASPSLVQLQLPTTVSTSETPVPWCSHMCTNEVSPTPTVRAASSAVWRRLGCWSQHHPWSHRCRSSPHRSPVLSSPPRRTHNDPHLQHASLHVHRCLDITAPQPASITPPVIYPPYLLPLCLIYPECSQHYSHPCVCRPQKILMHTQPSIPYSFLACYFESAHRAVNFLKITFSLEIPVCSESICSCWTKNNLFVWFSLKGVMYRHVFFLI